MASESQWVDDEMVVPFRVAADFEVRARDYGEALDFVDSALDMAKRSPAWIPDGPREGDMGDAIGVDRWERARVRPAPESRSVDDRFPGMVNDLALVETLREMRRAADAQAPLRLPEQLWERLDELTKATDPELHVNDPDDEHGREIYLGPAAQAAEYLSEGVYQAWSFDDHEYALVVAGSELAEGRVSAAFPRNRRDSRMLDEISGFLHDMDRDQSPAEVLRKIDRRVALTGRATLPHWLPMDVTATPGPAAAPTPSTVHVGVIVWSEDTMVEPTTVVDSNPVALARNVASLVHEILSGDVDAFDGAAEFLDSHPGPAQWSTPEDIEAWLEDLRASTPTPAVTLEQFIVPAQQRGTGQATQFEPHRIDQMPEPVQRSQSDDASSVFTVPVEFSVAAHSDQEARTNLLYVLSDEKPPLARNGMPKDTGVLQWRFPRREEAHPDGDGADLVKEVLAERGREVAPESDQDGMDHTSAPDRPDMRR